MATNRVEPTANVAGILQEVDIVRTLGVPRGVDGDAAGPLKGYAAAGTCGFSKIHIGDHKWWRSTAEEEEEMLTLDSTLVNLHCCRRISTLLQIKVGDTRYSSCIDRMVSE